MTSGLTRCGSFNLVFTALTDDLNGDAQGAGMKIIQAIKALEKKRQV